MVYLITLSLKEKGGILYGKQNKRINLNELKGKEDNIELISLNTDIDKSRLEELSDKDIANLTISLLSYGYLNLDEPQKTVSLR